VELAAPGDGKTLVLVRHVRLREADARAGAKTHWRGRLTAFSR
jgi:hypothetical protein